MTDTEQVPQATHPTAIPRVRYDFATGDLRYIARLAVRDEPLGPKAVWRNEVGSAEVSC